MQSDNVEHHRVACAGKSVLSKEKRRRTNTPVHALVIRSVRAENSTKEDTSDITRMLEIV